MKKNILFFILGAIIFSGVTAVALNINARDTAYDNTNSGSSATNMQDAIDDLYERSGNAKIIDCGTISASTANSTFDVSTCYDGDLTKLTKDNFYVVPLSVHGYCYASQAQEWTASACDANVALSYNINGTLTISGTYCYGTQDGHRTNTQAYINRFKVLLIPSL